LHLEITEAAIITALENFVISTWVKVRGFPLVLIEAITLPARKNIVAPTYDYPHECKTRFWRSANFVRLVSQPTGFAKLFLAH
jgi:hypothetical protein